VQRTLLQELEREPTVEELAERSELSVRRVCDLLRVMQPARSLERFEFQGAQFADVGPAPEQHVLDVSLQEEILDMLMELSDRERLVVCRRFGLDGAPPETLEEIGDRFGVTRERIRQIESKTLVKLRHPNRRRRLAEYLRD
jgi:RNA polymerase primary sigma factor